MSEWITFEEAASAAGCTVGELCAALSHSGSCTDPTTPADPAKPPSHPAVRVILDRDYVSYAINEKTTFAFPTITAHGMSIVVINSKGVVGVNRIHGGDLIAWLADRSVKMLLLPLCSACGGSLGQSMQSPAYECSKCGRVR